MQLAGRWVAFVATQRDVPGGMMGRLWIANCAPGMDYGMAL
jgi:hypothetical protein